ncbi:MAG: DNA topoisomerase I [Candidatus Bathyarchaeota archaeon]|nr:DNA topoisomerase I [Candidatus Bathyarchaeota archaeon]
MKQLSHNGVLLPKYEFKGFKNRFRGKIVRLTPEQEEMAVAWSRKIGTPYVDDSTFRKNFFGDFSKSLDIKEKIGYEDFDFSEIIDWIESERLKKENMSREEKKKLAEKRKMVRETNKEKYGFAIVDGERVEVGAYAAEPAGIFMGRGKHPLRGKWKRSIKHNEITLNLSPDSPVPKGKWKEIVWQPDSMWIAKWDDPLRGKEKYIWLAETSPLKQIRERNKYDRSKKLEGKIEKIRSHIEKNLISCNIKRRKIATVCYLIDTLKLRVGDEKDKDEADTVGATTLRPGHINFLDQNTILFDFLGKDSIPFRESIKVLPQVYNNMREFAESSSSAIFNGVRSDSVSAFLSEVAKGVSAKVFRTYYATETVKEFLKNTKVTKKTESWKKKEFLTMANLEAAILLNHKKAIPKNYKKTLEKRRARLKELKTKKMTPKRIENIQKLRSRIRIMTETKGYNLNTSLKSYIDPRVIYRWGKRIDYNWRDYYSKSLERKFEWIEKSRA